MYKETFEHPRFSVGDRVRVVKAKACLFGYVINMEEYVNCEVVITDINWSKFYHCYEYRLNDDWRFVWDADCLEKIENTNESFSVVSPLHVDNSAIDEFLNSFIK